MAESNDRKEPERRLEQARRLPIYQTDPVTRQRLEPSPPGHDWGDYHYACGAGGWQLKASDLFKVINELATGLATATDNKLLTNAETLAMISNSNCLGWDCAVRGDCPDPYVCKNGRPPPYYHSNGQLLTTSTYAGILKCVPVVVYVNSALPWPYQSTGDIIDLVGDSYGAAQVNN